MAATNGIKIHRNLTEIYHVCKEWVLPLPSDVNWQEAEMRDEFANQFTILGNSKLGKNVQIFQKYNYWEMVNFER